MPWRGMSFTRRYEPNAITMATTSIKNSYPKTKQLNISMTIPKNSSANNNLKTLIDADMPSGCTCLGIVGFTTNDQALIPVAVRYVDNAYSLQIRNISTTVDFTNKNISVHYLYI